MRSEHDYLKNNYNEICMKLYPEDKIAQVEAILNEEQIWVCYLNEGHDGGCCSNSDKLLIKRALKKQNETTRSDQTK